jgi:AraC-like DNA-binding protein/DNA gyrase inhibitor GyrI
MKDTIINHILKYIEEHLTENIRIDDLESMTGYTQRHIQNMFKSDTGMPLGRYIRSRRLRRTAIILKLTSKSVTDIGVEAGFGSTQSFNREFKKMFGVSPLTYRKADTWSTDKFLLPFDQQGNEQAVFTVCELPEQILYGYCIHFQKSLAHLPVTPNILRWKSAADNLEILKTDVMRVYEFSPNSSHNQILDVKMFVGTTVAGINETEFTMSKVVPGGIYARFNFTGGWEDYRHLAHDIYMYILSNSGYMRRDGEDIEHFSYMESMNRVDGETELNMTYYVPITPCP